MSKRRLAVSLLCLTPYIQARAQAPSHGPDAAAFDRLDGRAQELVHTVRCATYVSRMRAQGRFGPPDSLGQSGHCVRIDGHDIGVFLDADSITRKPRRLSAVKLVDGTRYTGALDTAGMVARTLASEDAVTRGHPAYVKANRTYAPLLIWPSGDSLQVWLMPTGVFSGKSLGGEHGYIYTSDGRKLVEEINAFDKFRTLQLPDTGNVILSSTESELPLFSELVLANLINGVGRQVTINTTRYSSTLTGRGVSLWVHMPRR